MNPDAIDPQLQSDEKACAERIDYALKKYGCMFDCTCIIKNGFTQIQVGVAKIPPELRRKMKEAEKNGQPLTPNAPTASA